MTELVPAPPLTAPDVRRLAERWYAGLDRHDDPAELTALLADEGLELRFPEGTFHGHAGFARWYAAVCHRFFDEEHVLTDIRCEIDGARALVGIRVNWQARRWNPPAARSEWLGFAARQTWVVARGGSDPAPRIRTYVCEALEPLPGSAAL
jgi:hypothetical protein